MKQVAGKLKLDLAQYRELAAFAQFGSDMDKATKAQLDRGARVTEILKQPQYKPMPVEQQVVVIFAAINGFMDDVSVDKIQEFEAAYLRFMESAHPEILKAIAEEKKISDQTNDSLVAAIKEFKQGFSY